MRLDRFGGFVVGSVSLALVVVVGCPPQAPTGNGDGDVPACAAQGEACTASGDCCDNLVCTAAVCVADDADGGDGGPVDGGNVPAEGGVPEERLQPSDFTYEGAFRLPDDFNWGALGLSFYPDGDGGAGTLLVTGFQSLTDPAHPGETCWDPDWDCYAYYGEVTIPTPAAS